MNQDDEDSESRYAPQYRQSQCCNLCDKPLRFLNGGISQYFYQGQAYHAECFEIVSQEPQVIRITPALKKVIK